jgi:opine dehydrogenase
MGAGFQPENRGSERGAGHADVTQSARTILWHPEMMEKAVMEKTTQTVAIIGAGIGGLYLAAELGIAGNKLRLHDIDDSKLLELRARGGVDVEGERGGFAAVERATADLGSAVGGADVIIVVTGGNTQAVVARSLAPLLIDGQVILLIQGNTGGSLIVRRALDDTGCRADVDIAEMDNYPYSCWRLGPTQIRPIIRKRWLQIASFPGNRIGVVFSRLSPLFPEAVAAPNILYTGLTNANAMLHVANCVANAARIESANSYKFYAEGVTPAVASLYEAISAERVAVAAALGASVPTLADWFDRVYGVRETTLVETCRRLTFNSDGPYQATGAPKSLDHKFITEDVPTGLIPMSALGAVAGVKTPAINALIEVVGCMTGKDFAAEGRTLERLGLNGMDRDQIRRVLEEGRS